MNKPTLATVATSGSYNDLSDKPTIPTVNNAILTIQKNGMNVQTFTANASSDVTANITVPTKVSELTNDSGYTTNIGTVTQVKVGNTEYDPSSGVISLPAYPTDEEVKQKIAIGNSNRPLLMSYAQTTTPTNEVIDIVYRNNKIYANPYTGTITASHFYNSATSSSLDFIVGNITSLTEVD